MSTILSVEEVTYALEKSLPPNLIVSAVGTVNSGGWSKFELARVEHVTVPSDKIQEFSFEGKAPTGIVTHALVPNNMAHARIEEIDIENYWGLGLALTGVRVVASSNALEKKIK